MSELEGVGGLVVNAAISASTALLISFHMQPPSAPTYHILCYVLLSYNVTIFITSFESRKKPKKEQHNYELEHLNTHCKSDFPLNQL